MDVYSDWVDACESVAKEGGDPADGLGSYGDDVGGERGSETRYDRHALTAEDENAADYDDDA